MYKPKVFLSYDFFSPAFKAGGPIQSCTNLVQLLENDVDFFIYTTCYDLDGKKLNIKKNQWVEFEHKSRVFYADKNFQKYKIIYSLIKKSSADIIYIQGIFSLVYTIYPLMAAIFLKKKVIVAPRGMLQKGALALKSTKKKLYLAILRPFFKKKNISWHATDKVEKEDIEKYIGKGKKVDIISNIPRLSNKLTSNKKENDRLKLITISLIARKKNHILIINSLKNLKLNITYDIFGPIKESEYYYELKRAISNLPANIKVNFNGSITPQEVDLKLQSYDLFILPTFGENFGHAIFEALGNGIPICISKNTPWQNLGNAGYTLDLETSIWENTLLKLAHETNKQWLTRKESARTLACNFIESAHFREKYLDLFN
ncbi:glycosyltransferase [Flammeovirga sp. SubArs3]|uniref:glycosyltransferase n=1 Tax=Flammeovirga sp. SubArs3 TaxID=2995316 RepID=UPI00248B6B8E|nr:glycosyltransferase [Flammeovirga sp. SubArs3]